MNHAQLSMALATATSAQPAMTPDMLWTEKLIAGYLGRTRNLQVAPEQVLVAPGCKMALALVNSV